MGKFNTTSAKIGEAASSNEQDDSGTKLQKGLLDSFNLLLLTNFILAEETPAKACNTLDAALQAATDAFAENTLPATSEKALVGQHLQEESSIEQAMKELGEAVGNLRAEIAAGSGLVG